MDGDLKPCPFCGGQARITGKDCAFGGQNVDGKKKLKYKIRIMCNKCHSLGKPVTTDWFSTDVHNFWDFQRGQYSAFFQKYADVAIEAWNKRI